MRVFISWSGERSRFIAVALRDWLPNVIQSLEPWMSDKDIDGGSRWLLALSGQLNEAMTGILCVTPENQANPWLVFEAGALSKTIGQTMVCPLLYDLEPAQLTGPLSQFQAKVLDRESVLSILNTLNASMATGKLTPERLERAFTLCWPELEAKLKIVPTSEALHKPKRKSEDMLEEILTIVREQRRDERMGPIEASARLSNTTSVNFQRLLANIRASGPHTTKDEEAIHVKMLQAALSNEYDRVRAGIVDKRDKPSVKNIGNEGKFD